MATYSSTVRFPGETAEYRAARDRLLAAERDLRRNLEQVAALRRELPIGGAVAENYTFEEGGPDIADADVVRTVKLSELFRNGLDTLVLYSLMFGPEMKEACPLCTSILDGLDGQSPHINQRVNFAVVAKSPIGRIRAHARGRGWNHLQLLSSAHNTYNRDYHGEIADGSQVPSLNVFVRRAGAIHHAYNTELFFAPTDPGQDPRHVDLIWPLWNVLDFTPEGRGVKWGPRLRYE